MHRVCWLALLPLVLDPPAALPQGAPLGPEFRVNTYTTGYQFQASVAADASGNFVVVWTSSQDGADTSVHGQRYSSTGAPLGPEFRVNTYTTFNQRMASVAADASGNFVVVFTNPGADGFADGISGQRYSSSGTPLGPEFVVNTYTTDAQNDSSVAADASGDFVVVWTSTAQDGSNYGVFGQRYSSSGLALGPEFLVNTYITGHQYRPSIAADTSGNFVVVWTSSSQDGDGSGVFGQRYSSTGAPLGPEFRVNTYTTSPQTYGSVAADASGNFVAVWTSFSQDGDGSGIFGQRYSSSGAPLGPEFRVNTYTTNAQDYPSVAADATGDFVVVWVSLGEDGSYRGVFGQRFAGTGAPVGPEFRVNTYTTSGQSQATVAADASGNFVVVWRSYGQDGSAQGVFGQRYGQIVPVELLGFSPE
jgi:hypothetical protein